MKTNLNFRLPGYLYLLMCMILISSCSTDAVEPAEVDKRSNEKFKELQPDELAGDTKTYTENSCESICVLEGGWEIAKKRGYKSVNVGKDTKEMSYTVYNTNSHFVVEVLYEITNESAKVDANISITVNGQEKVSDRVKSGSTVSHLFALPENYRACDVINYHIKQVAYGEPVIFEGEYKLIPTCEETEPSVGQKRYGGIIVYILKEGDPGYDPDVEHGLIAAPQSLPAFNSWGNSSYYPFQTGYDGRINTSQIVNYFGDGNYAAKVCEDYEINGFDDWYLPSIGELSKLYYMENITTYTFWSSTTATHDQAFIWQKGVPWSQIDYFFSGYKVWPFRSF